MDCEGEVIELATLPENGDICNLTPEDFICINVSGMVYETLRSTLNQYPDTLLGKGTYQVSLRGKEFEKKENNFPFQTSTNCIQ